MLGESIGSDEINEIRSESLKSLWYLAKTDKSIVNDHETLLPLGPARLPTSSMISLFPRVRLVPLESASEQSLDILFEVGLVVRVSSSKQKAARRFFEMAFSHSMILR